MPEQPSRIDQALTLAVLAILIVGCYLVLRPFLTALVWAAILCTTTWPLYLRLHEQLGRRDALAALAMVLLLSLLMLAPFIVVGATIADNAERMAMWGRQLLASGPPEAPGISPQGTVTRAADTFNTSTDTTQPAGSYGVLIFVPVAPFGRG